MAYRPQNCCKTCGYTWFPKGKNLSNKCPNCGSPNVQYVPNYGIGCCLVFVIGPVGFFAICAGILQIPSLPMAPAPVQPTNSNQGQPNATNPETTVSDSPQPTGDDKPSSESELPAKNDLVDRSMDPNPDLSKQAQGQLSAGKKLIELGQEENAIPWLQKAINSSPDSPAGQEAKKVLERLEKKKR